MRRARRSRAHARLTSPPIADNLRLFALRRLCQRPSARRLRRARAGRGRPGMAHSRPHGHDLSDAVVGHSCRAGGGATVDWLVTDQLRLAVSGELYTWETPLRALLFGMTANEFAAKATYRWHELRSVAASFAYLPFTDGNQRFAGGVTFREKLVNLPGFDLTGLAEAYASSNSLGGTAALLQSDARPVADRRPARRAHAVAALRQQPRPGADRRCRPLFRIRLLRQLDRHGELRASLALRSADRVSLRRHADAAASTTARSRTR